MTIVNDKTIVKDALARDIPFFITSGGKITIDVETSEPFKFLRVEGAGDIIIATTYGGNIYIPDVLAGEWLPVVGTQVLSSATVGGAPRTTTASDIWWYGGM